MTMRIFVAGASGAVGRRLVPRLISAGHSVVGLTRTSAKAELIRKLGAEPVVADGLDEKAMRAAVGAAQPDVIVHEMTDLGGIDLRHFDRSFATSNRLRTEGTDNLIAAAKVAGSVKRFVAQSFCGWPYARTGGAMKSETDPLDPSPPQEFRASLDAIRYLEDSVANVPSLEGLVLRYGAFYGYGTGMFEGAMIDQVAHRRVPLVGSGEGWWSFLHIDDAAEATMLAVERGASGIYNIVDDEPAQAREWLPVLADMLGAKPPFRIPTWLARFVAGEHLVTMMTESRAGSNAKARRELGWAPAYPSWRQGFAEIVEQRQHYKTAA
jgi:nucleoside-diphosphate-sugar epimerase